MVYSHRTYRLVDDSRHSQITKLTGTIACLPAATAMVAVMTACIDCDYAEHVGRIASTFERTIAYRPSTVGDHCWEQLHVRVY